MSGAAIRGRLRRALRDEGGTATIEFVILFPLFVLIMLNSIEASIMMTRGTMLDRGLDLAVRELRLNTGSAPSYDAFRESVCANAGLLTGNCLDTLQVELRRVDPATWSALDADARCVSRSDEIVPLVDVDPSHYAAAGSSRLMMIRACLVAEPIVPNVGLMALLPWDEAGYRLVSVSAFVQEPMALDVSS